MVKQKKRVKGRSKSTTKKPAGATPKTPFSRGAWIFLIVVSSTWMFVLGILVGRGSSPLRFDIDRIETKLQSYMKESIEKEEQESRDLLAQLKDPIASKGLVDVEESRKTGGISSGQPVSSGAAEKEQQPKATTAAPSSPAEDSEAAPSPAADPAADEGDQDAEPRYTVQVSSLKTASAAAQMVLRLKRMGYPAFMKPVRLPEVGVTYRVLVGDFKNRASADYLGQRLKKDNINGMVRMR